MYNIFEEEFEPVEEYAKIRFIFKRVEHSDLQKSIEALKSQMETKPSGTVSYTTASNHLITAVSEFPLYVSCNISVSSVSTGGGNQDDAYKAYGTINTGYIPNCRSLLNAYKKKFIAERKNQG